VDVLDVVGAGVGLGDGAGGLVGGATVGLGVVGFGAAVVGAFVGLAECAVAGLGAEVVAPADLCAFADADGEEPLADGEALDPALELPDGWVFAVGAVPAELLAVLEKRVVMPNAVTTLSNAVRQVMRDSLRRPESLPAVRLLCLMAATQPAARLRAHQDGASESLPADARSSPEAAAAGRSPSDRPANRAAKPVLRNVMRWFGAAASGLS
jgi:hypothetical protein